MSIESQDAMTDDDVMFTVETHDPDRDPSETEQNKSSKNVEQSKTELILSHDIPYNHHSFDEPYDSPYDPYYISTINRSYGSSRYIY